MNTATWIAAERKARWWKCRPIWRQNTLWMRAAVDGRPVQRCIGLIGTFADMRGFEQVQTALLRAGFSPDTVAHIEPHTECMFGLWPRILVWLRNVIRSKYGDRWTVGFTPALAERIERLLLSGAWIVIVSCGTRVVEASSIIKSCGGLIGLPEDKRLPESSDGSCSGASGTRRGIQFSN